METIDPAAHGVEILENVWIPLPDGSRLAARLWLPPGARERPVPALFEYLPYRKRDLTRYRDDLNHGWLASHGLACVRVDMRGSGESDGILVDQYREQELSDGEAAIAWIAAQPWCNGKVGMFGISWGGFNGLQIAARRPPALAAVVTTCSTDDLYADNMHYMGGCLLTDNLVEATTMFSINTCPPDPALVGDEWRAMWRERLAKSGLWIDTWLRHQRRDAYWQHGSVSEDYAAIRCPVLIVGGWADGFHNAIFRLLEHLEAPRWALVGPWAHMYPHYGLPGPAIGFLQECHRFFSAFLDDGPPYEAPRLRLWMMESVPPATRYEERPGRWVTEPAWPSPTVETRAYPLAPARIFQPEQTIRRQRRRLSIQSPLSLGKVAGKWLSSAVGPELAHDQREEDGGALIFDTLPLKSPLEILGAPVVELEVSANRPVAMLCARLNDLAPDDKSTRVTYGLLNLCHRDGSAEPRPLQPGVPVRVRLALSVIGARFAAGHRIRLALSTSYWPIAWPSPEPARVVVDTAASRLLLPVRHVGHDEDRLVHFEPPAGGRTPDIEMLVPARHDWLIHRSLGEYRTVQEVIADQGTYRLAEIDLTVAERMISRFSHLYDSYGSVTGETLTERRFARGDWAVRTTTRTVLSSTPTHFLVTAQLDAYEGETRVFAENYDAAIERDLV
ncbi:MAG: CocE/NonD family hydrolase [Sandaracinaceae bacterium]